MKRFIFTLLLVTSALTYALAQIDPYTYQGGKVHLSGRLVSSDTATTIPQMMAVYLENSITRKEMHTGVEVNPDGTFEIDLAVAHPCFSDLKVSDKSLFMLPGDTIEITVDVATKELNIMRSEAAKRMLAVSDNEYSLMKGLQRGWQAGSSEDGQSVKAYVDTVMGRIDTYLTATPAPTYPDTIPAHELLLSEIERLAPVSFAFSQALMARMYYYNPDHSIPAPDFSSIARVMAKHPDVLIDNPAVVLASPNSDMIINYTEYKEYLPHILISPSTKVAVANQGAYIIEATGEPWVLPENYDAKAHDAYRRSFSNKVFNFGTGYANAQQQILKKSGLAPDMLLSQIALSREFIKKLDEQVKSPDAPHLLASLMASVMPRFTNPVVALNIINQYRELVRLTEGATSNVNAIPDVLAEIIRPYKGNVLLVDFWGMGCGPCKAGMLFQQDILKKLEGRPVKFLYVANGDE